MPTPPTVEAVTEYLGETTSHTETEIAGAYAAEVAAQTRVCRFPADPPEPAEPLPYPEDLAEALCRRVQRNLAMRALPLGYQQSATEFGASSTRIGADPEIKRLEGPFRKLVHG